MKVKVNLPDSIKNYTKTTKYITNAFTTGIINDSANALSKAGATVHISNSNRMTATIGKLSNRGVVDLKPLFMNSTKAKRKKNGGWYLVIPISLSSRKLISSSGRKTYDNIRKSFSELSPSSTATLNVEGLFSRDYSSLQNMTLPSLVPPAPSGNITATKSATGKRTTYVAFRTVSDKSSPQSWVINRKNVSQNNSSMTLQKDVASLIRQRIRQSEGK